MEKSLSEYTRAELEQELKNRKKAEIEAAKQRDNARRESIYRNVDAFLLLVPEHERTNCSDQSRKNEGNCIRCDLVAAKARGYYDGKGIVISYKAWEYNYDEVR